MIVARADVQFALFMSASAYSTLSCSDSASFIFRRPMNTGGMLVTTITPIINQPAQIP